MFILLHYTNFFEVDMEVFFALAVTTTTTHDIFIIKKTMSTAFALASRSRSQN